jgi:inner membrane transporter RhtA
MSAPAETVGPPGGGTRFAATLVVGAIVSVQCGAALATTLFDQVGTSGAVFLRSLFGALALIALARGSLPSLRGRGVPEVILFGVTLAGVNLCFYAALDRLPLGVAVTLEFLGPLGIALVGSRRRRDVVWALLAALGVALLADGGGGGADALGVALALAAAAFWAGYILLSARVGAIHPGLGGLAVAAMISTTIVAIPGIPQGGAELLHPSVLAVGLAVGVLSSAIPYSLELEALRRLPKTVFGVLMSLEPAVAAAVGFIALSQDLAATELVAIALVIFACAGALRSAAAHVPRDS